MNTVRKAVTVRTTDAKGRVTLGEGFANRAVIVEQTDPTEVRITLARVIPEREAWLYANPKARRAVAVGISQAKVRRFAKKAPNLAADNVLLERIANKRGYGRSKQTGRAGQAGPVRRTALARARTDRAGRPQRG